MQLNYRSPELLYKKIKDEICKLAITGAILPGEALMSVNELSSRLAVNPAVIQKAYQELENEGFLYEAENGGIFVSADLPFQESRKAYLLEQFDRLVGQLDTIAVSQEELMDRMNRRMEGRDND